MLATLIIVFREVLEAGLVVGIVLAASRGVPGRGLWVTGGCTAGVLGAIVVAGFASQIANAVEGIGQELFKRGHPVRGSLHARLAQYLDEPARP
jgi:high-affinity iron transporter